MIVAVKLQAVLVLHDPGPVPRCLWPNAQFPYNQFSHNDLCYFHPVSSGKSRIRYAGISALEETKDSVHSIYVICCSLGCSVGDSWTTIYVAKSTWRSPIRQANVSISLINTVRATLTTGLMVLASLLVLETQLISSESAEVTFLNSWGGRGQWRRPV